MSLFLLLSITTLFWGIGQVLVKKGLTHLTAWQTYALDAFLIAPPIWIGYGLLAGGDLTSATPIAVGASLFITTIYAIYYYTISLGPIGLVSPLIATYPIYTFILVYLFLEERLNFFASVGILLTLSGIILISIQSKLKLKFDKWLILALFVAIGYGISAFLGKLALSSVTNATYLMLLAVSQLLVVVIWRMFIADPILPRIKFHNFRFSFLGITLFNIANILYYIALERGLASVVVPLSNTYVAVTAVLSLIWLKERILPHQILGIVSIVAGVILVGANTVGVRSANDMSPCTNQVCTNIVRTLLPS